MANEVNVGPTPIQRNLFDVATDLTTMYYKRVMLGNVAEVQDTYLKFYAVAVAARQGKINLSEYLPKKDS